LTSHPRVRKKAGQSGLGHSVGDANPCVLKGREISLAIDHDVVVWRPFRTRFFLVRFPQGLRFACPWLPSRIPSGCPEGIGDNLDRLLRLPLATVASLRDARSRPETIEESLLDPSRHHRQPHVLFVAFRSLITKVCPTELCCTTATPRLSGAIGQLFSEILTCESAIKVWQFARSTRPRPLTVVPPTPQRMNS